MKLDVPEDTSDTNLDFVRWQRDTHRLERDLYLVSACMLSLGLLISVGYYRDKFERYVAFKAKD